MAAPVIVTGASSVQGAVSGEATAQGAGTGDKAHHKKGGGFVNPWESFKDPGRGPTTLWNAYKSWESHPVPSLDLLPQRREPDFAPPAALSSDAERSAWSDDLKATWLGHACFLVEFPAPAAGDPHAEGGGGKGGERRRGFRVLFDPVWSHRCSPLSFAGPQRVTKPPIALDELPHVDAVVISHNHYDHLDIATLKHLYAAQPAGSVHFFAPLGNKEWFKANIGVAEDEVTELDWWEERELRLGGNQEGAGEREGEGRLRVVCTPCQHVRRARRVALLLRSSLNVPPDSQFTGRSLTDRNDTLWASWAISSSTGGKVWFGGDTGYRTVPRAPHDLATLPVCPEFSRIGEREGPFDLGMIPIGAYDPRWLFSSVHCAPEDSVELHRETRCKKSIGMHWATWQLTPEEMTEPPKRLRAACAAYGIGEAEFGVTDFGETVRCKVDGGGRRAE
ncbi:N-acyl-phosphatidylethanolamine-hydrolyzing phospholipase D [Rhodotorula diobovata]|uniref:N-acyl-phosphatidylethanolamine-hydrolyzing phospholipase D n=1 Tax=Rhodotorula diobovata TaxID=5288 RepID=A0A5C5FX09_9BASI|nr:N-acyl-phosphatidylethanolamine-hydrolyzing phospholipase D [Rhodotorula diobovata]